MEDYPQVEHPGQGQKLRVLIVEDEATVGYLLLDIVSAEGHEVVLCRNGSEAVERLKNHEYDLVITDLIMPGADGFTVLREATQLYPKIVVVMITGYATVQDAIKAVNAGAYYYLRKPFHLDEIRVLVRHACERIYIFQENERLAEELRKTAEQLRLLLDQQSKGEGEALFETEEPEVSSALMGGQRLPPSYYRSRTRDTEVLSDLERMAQLKNDGFLTEEEVTALKKKLIDNFEG